MKAIDTHYKGYRFRSRLEARWAVFFDALNLQWSYEEEGYKMPGGTYYLPDFKVTNLDGCVRFYEIKPSGQTHDDKFASFRNQLTSYCNSMECPENDYLDAALLSGDPYEFLIERGHPGLLVCPRCGFIGEPAYGADVYGSNDSRFGCQPCDFNTPCGGGNSEDVGLFCVYTPHKGDIMTTPGWQKTIFRVIKNAAKKARSARFEHGERP